MGQVVQENFLIPPLVAQVGGVAVHRHRIATAMSERFPLRIEEFPFPLPGLGIDMVWNPRLADDGVRRPGCARVLRDAAAEVVAPELPPDRTTRARCVVRPDRRVGNRPRPRTRPAARLRPARARHVRLHQRAQRSDH